MEPLRGNVQTRLKKLADGVVDATVLALAGLSRLGLADRASSVLEPEDMLPAIAQGAIGVTCRTDDAPAHRCLAALDHPDSHQTVRIERAFLAELDGSCRTPIAGLAEIMGAELRFRGLVLKPDGSQVRRTSLVGLAAHGEDLARRAAGDILGGLDFFALPTAPR